MMNLRLLPFVLLFLGVAQTPLVQAQDVKPMEVEASLVNQIIAKDSAYAVFFKAIPEKEGVLLCYDAKGMALVEAQVLENKIAAERPAPVVEATETVQGVPDMEPAPSLEVAPGTEPTPEVTTAPIVPNGSAPLPVSTKKNKRKKK